MQSATDGQERLRQLRGAVLLTAGYYAARVEILCALLRARD
jgi:hypothetical protein